MKGGGGGWLLLVLGVLILVVLLPAYCLDVKHTSFDLGVDDVLARLQPGDLVLSTHISDHVTPHRLQNNLVRVGTHGNKYHHVSLAVKWQEKMHLFDFLPDWKLVPWLTHVSSAPVKMRPEREQWPVTGLVPVHEYFARRKALFAYRPARVPMDNERLLQIIAEMEQTAEYHTKSISKWLTQLFKPAEPIDIADATCAEGMAYLLQQSGVQHAQFQKGMAFLPFVEVPSSTFQDTIYQVGPVQYRR